MPPTPRTVGVVPVPLGGEPRRTSVVLPCSRLIWAVSASVAWGCRARASMTGVRAPRRCPPRAAVGAGLAPGPGRRGACPTAARCPRPWPRAASPGRRTARCRFNASSSRGAAPLLELDFVRACVEFNWATHVNASARWRTPDEVSRNNSTQVQTRGRDEDASPRCAARRRPCLPLSKASALASAASGSARSCRFRGRLGAARAAPPACAPATACARPQIPGPWPRAPRPALGHLVREGRAVARASSASILRAGGAARRRGSMGHSEQGVHARRDGRSSVASKSAARPLDSVAPRAAALPGPRGGPADPAAAAGPPGGWGTAAAAWPCPASFLPNNSKAKSSGNWRVW